MLHPPNRCSYTSALAFKTVSSFLFFSSFRSIQPAIIHEPSLPLYFTFSYSLSVILSHPRCKLYSCLFSPDHLIIPCRLFVLFFFTSSHLHYSAQELTILSSVSIIGKVIFPWHWCDFPSPYQQILLLFSFSPPPSFLSLFFLSFFFFPKRMLGCF